MPGAQARTHYELLGVEPDCSFDELRAAYRRLARERHPDVAVARPGLGSMAEVNEAWRVLSDVELRRRYNDEIRDRITRPVSQARSSTAPWPAATPPRPTEVRYRVGSRRQAWAAGVQAQMARLARQAGRSATQTLLIRAPRAPRSVYEEVVDALVADLSADAESRARAARAAGVAPLDLAVGATLVGVRTVADTMRRNAPLGVDEQTMMAAELLDRMWDVIAHELPVQLTSSLGGNPHVAQALARHRQ
jgi:hypothetical protein